MSKWIDIMITPEGAALTLLQFFQIAVYYIKTDQMDYSGDTYEAKGLDISVSMSKLVNKLSAKKEYFLLTELHNLSI